MPELATAFQTAQSNVEPSEGDWENAPAAHDEIGRVLAEDEKLSESGISPILIGSYGRRVSIRRVFDVDMFCRLEDYPTGLAASDVIDRVYDVLRDQYSSPSVTKFDRSVTVLMPDSDGLFVDIVPARKAGTAWEIPVRNGGWIETNPIKMTELKEDKNAEYGEMYVPCVKLLRQSRRTLLGRAKLGGFTVEMALFTACEDGLVTGNSMGEFFASALEGVAEVFRRMADEGFQMPDPSRDGEVLVFDEDADFETARDKFSSAAIDARAAYNMGDDEAGKAALLLQGILGSNDDFTNVFPMPSGYDKQGNKRNYAEGSKPGNQQTTAGDLRFG
ncbi:nucleotidyltransferase [Pseudarthrobacter oxydans]|uniref:nucleotidyltransferase n=1 Tax=Pseudarthrobacter oxydans TaxID=1671 RepID=UPI002AA8E62E|nr:nucleotidyltransferase [Pseudarthrobacter oxydans]WPU07807.1 nucleotidyltransferase [Pseudarthrobacter oxydans]